MHQRTIQNMLPAAVAAGGLEQVIRIANEAPYLSAEQERAYGLRLRDHNDIEAAQMLVLSHLRYVIHVARGFVGYGLPLADLVQEGAIGLMKAVRRFDPDRGVRLVSFATHWIKAEIREFVIRNWHVVKIATTKAQRKLFFNLRSHKARLEHLSRRDAEGIARELGVSRDEVLEMDARLSEHAVPFDRADEDDAEHLPSPTEYLADERFDPEQRTVADAETRYTRQRLLTGLQRLDERSREIVRARWLSEPRLGLKELGERFGVSAERVRQIEKQALQNLRAEFT